MGPISILFAWTGEDESMSFAVGESIGPYRILEQLGQGGMATVYKAYHASLDRYVAIKALHPAFMEDPNFLARFQREARVVAKLEHANIVPIYDYAEHQGRPYLVMKFIEGQTLKARLGQGGLTQEETVQIAEAIGAGLSYAHRSGILHRDVKPSNVLITPEGQIYLADFGLARIAAAGESTLSSDMMVGTPQYISPEQAKGNHDLDEGTDIYSFGVLLYELVVGRVPFTADTPYSIIHDHIYSPLPLPRQMNPGVPDAVERVLLKALAKDRADRYATVQDLVQAFKTALKGSAPAPAPVAQPIAPAVSVKPVAPQPVPAVTVAAPVAVKPAASRQELPAVPASIEPVQPAKKRLPKKAWWFIIPVVMVFMCLCGFVMVRVMGGGQNAVAQARVVVNQNPDDYWAHYDLAVALENAGQMDEAFGEYDAALNLGGSDLAFYASVGEDMIDRGHWMQAAQAYMLLAEKNPDPLQPEEMTNLHESLYRVAPDPAMYEIISRERIARFEPGYAAVVEARHALHTGGPVRVRMAQEFIDRVLAENPDHPVALLVQAEIDIQAGDPAQARGTLERVLSLPNLAEWVISEAEMMIESIEP